MLADPTIGDRISRKVDGGRRPEFIREIPDQLLLQESAECGKMLVGVIGRGGEVIYLSADRSESRRLRLTGYER